MSLVDAFVVAPSLCHRLCTVVQHFIFFFFILGTNMQTVAHLAKHATWRSPPFLLPFVFAASDLLLK